MILLRDMWYRLRFMLQIHEITLWSLLQKQGQAGLISNQDGRDRLSNQSTLVIKLFLSWKEHWKKSVSACLRSDWFLAGSFDGREIVRWSQTYKCSCRLGCHNSQKNSSVLVASAVSFVARTKDDFICSAVTNTSFSACRSISCQSAVNPWLDLLFRID